MHQRTKVSEKVLFKGTNIKDGINFYKRQIKVIMNDNKKDYGNLIAKKSERLVTALYLVTDLISDTEPIKQGLRKSAVGLLSSMNALAQLEVKDRVTEFKTSLKSVTEILSLLHVSITTGLVSDMNGNILMDGFRALQLVLEKKQPILTKEMLSIDNEEELNRSTSLSNAITSTSYDVLTPLSISRMNESVNTDENKKTNKMSYIEKLEKFDFNSNLNSNKVEKETNIVNDNDTDLKDFNKNTKAQTTFNSSFQLRKQSRRDQILALFVKGVDVSIKDISARIKGCSEKTIQRELNNLVFDGKIKRIGEKRWSRYVLR